MGAELDGKGVGFGAFQQHLELFGAFSDTNGEQAGGEGVQRAAVADFDIFGCAVLLEQPLDAADHAGAGGAAGFVDEVEAVHGMRISGYEGVKDVKVWGLGELGASW